MTLAPALTVPQQVTAKSPAQDLNAAEFFAGIGLARLGMEAAGIKVTWANDLSSDKREMYLGHFGQGEANHYKLADIKAVAENLDDYDVPRNLALAWASFPCTDLSLAGGRKGLAGKHSGTFWNLVAILEKLGADRPPVVALENVNGFATSHKGEDLKAAIRALNGVGYSVDVITLDARSWVPQSRPRLFLIAALKVPEQVQFPSHALRPRWLDAIFADDSLRTHQAQLPAPPEHRSTGWTSIVDQVPLSDPRWWDESRMEKFNSELSAVQMQKIAGISSSAVSYRTAYRRTRNGKPAWEIRADDIAGCLRTAGGGSSKQAVVRIQDGQPLRARWMTSVEYARLMGADEYVLPDRPSQAVMGFGDAVCVNTVQWLSESYLVPLIEGKLTAKDELQGLASTS
ncbi:DNA cytosine methyltransferase [Streptomyces alfalfae]|uniref:DNA cytosine methyltransferase n=1 Tax=Streptomyces alfalfae TaxID=1642299 RepID=UPI001BA49D6F|nr:DNA (cytosine-5-)-methyltransferase [Streptomyces alfalfae]